MVHSRGMLARTFVLAVSILGCSIGVKAANLTFGDLTNQLGLNADPLPACAEVGCPVPQTYGDTADIDVSYSTTAAAGNDSFIRYYHYGYGSATTPGVFAASEFGTLNITLTPAPGLVIRLLGFDASSWYTAGAQTGQPVQVVDSNNTVLYSNTIDAPASGILSVDFLIESTLPLTLRFGNNWLAGLDNVRYSVFPEGQGEPIPEPSTMALIGAGLLAAGWLRRRG